MLRYRDMLTHTTEVRDVTSLTVDECAVLVPPFEAAFLASMAEWTLHGWRRQARRSTTSTTCPLPPPADRLVCMRVSLKQHPTHLRHGRGFGMRQSTATPWRHGFLPVWRHAWRTLGDPPCRRVEAWRQPLGWERVLRPWASAPSEAVHAAPPEAPPFVA